MGFERILNTFIWNGKVEFAIGDTNTRLNVLQNLRSKLIRSIPVSTQGEYDGLIGFRSGLGRGWSLLARTSSLVVSDNRSIDLGKLAQHQGLLGTGYTNGQWDLDLLGGYELNAQQGEYDQGPSLDVSLHARDLKFQEVRASIASDWQKSFLGRRAPAEQNDTLEIKRNFSDGSSDSLVIRYSNQRREFYTAADQGVMDAYSVNHNIFRRDAVTFEIANRLSYQVGSSSRLTVDGGIQNRTIDRAFLYKDILQPLSITLDSRIQELVLNGSASISSQLFDWLSGIAGMSFQERDERHGVAELEGVPFSVIQSQQVSARRLEYTSRRTSAWASVVSQLSTQDRLNVSASASILRYDTPDTLNIDDRDELLLSYMIKETHRFSQYVTLDLAVNASLSHLVYLDRLQSANNNWNRVLSFSPRITLEPAKWLISDNVGEVVANYTVYDFEEQVASVKSYSFRQAFWSDSTVINLSRSIDLDFAGAVRVFERGIFRWKQFKEKPLDYFVEKSIWPRIAYKASADLSLSVGYRYFSQDQYVYDGEARNFTHSIVTVGPTVSLQWFAPGGTNVALSGWRVESLNDSRLTSTVSNLSFSVSMFF